MTNILIDSVWIYFVLWALLLLVVKYFFNFKPKFVVPVSHLNSRWNIILKISKVLFVVIILLSFFNIQFLVGKTIETQKNIPIQILFDVSLSMTADDIKPSRFDAAKSAVSGLMRALEWYSFSIITFSWIPFVYMPFSDDLNSMSLYRESTDLTDFPPVNDFVWTAVWDALILAMENMNASFSTGVNNSLVRQGSGEQKVIVLITDGDSNVGYDPIQLIPALQDENIVVFALGVGEQNYLIGYDYFDTPVKTSINTSLLVTLAEKTGGRFYRVLDKEKFWSVFEEIVKVVRAQEKDLVVNQYRRLNRILYPLAIFFLLIILWMRIFVLKKVVNN